MKLDTIGVMIATRKLILPGPKTATVKIGKPRKYTNGHDYYCPYQIVGFGDERIRYAGGIDAVQALQLTLRKIGADLYTSKEARAGALTWEAGNTKSDLGFPVPDVLRDLAPR